MAENSRETLFEQVDRARKIMQLPREATLAQIKKKFRDLIREWHPDKTNMHDPMHAQKTQQIVEANKVITNYLKNYKISFDEEMVNRYRSMEERWWELYGHDPMWGPG